ncbi:hypothetical protein GCM10011371_08410 [Novosphingobium marinum]|uniref:Uncharacterized protein n=1 Tax=Novosphingobium marinum TaxID=1514948 RepID=A0A7Y9XTY0_9SPHN|nr:hypothetical protein [Novosphingobium marinum]NYH94529.1 hypothetical protein [Novosphingobium marinum]GGC23030.1 hypothetical protein GCM10011371_08410 [Novosphingobium marinum]
MTGNVIDLRERLRLGRQEADAEAFTSAIEAIAASYPPEAASTPREAREAHFSLAQQLAWTLRFGSKAEIEAAILALEDAHL